MVNWSLIGEKMKAKYIKIGQIFLDKNKNLCIRILLHDDSDVLVKQDTKLIPFLKLKEPLSYSFIAAEEEI